MIAFKECQESFISKVI